MCKELQFSPASIRGGGNPQTDGNCCMGRSSRSSRHVNPRLPGYFCSGTPPEDVSAAPCASCFLRDTSDFPPATSDRPPAQPSRGHSFNSLPRPAAPGLPPAARCGHKAGPGRGGREGRAARGGSRDNTTALTLPRGPPAARGGGRALPADFSPHALARRRREPARPMTRRAAAGRCLPGRAASGTKSPRLLRRRRRRRHPSLGGSGEEETDSGGR